MSDVQAVACHNNSEYGIPATNDEFAQQHAAPRLLIVGASTRAAAWSAVRAGWRPVCADQFADLDLRQVADVVPVARYPNSLPEDLLPLSSEGWMFVGAMENHRPILTAILSSGQFGRYYGPDIETIAKLRDPLWLAERCRALHCYPDVLIGPDLTEAFSHGGHWLRKPLASGGGRAVRLLGSGVSLSPCDSEEPCYWQRLIEGVSVSALFLETNRDRRLLSVSAQLIGWSAAGAPTPFTYCGSIAPWPLADFHVEQLQRIAETIMDGLAYRGLLGLDLIWDGRQFWLIEVNPRYTASCELWEFLTGRSAVGEHLLAFGQSPLTASAGSSPSSQSAGPRVLGKLVIFADRNLTTPDFRRFLGPRPVWSPPWLADLPAADQKIPQGAPLCTVFAGASTLPTCWAKLQRRAWRVRSWCRPTAP
jgi:predicted ATP-grasp superfamily ATP-dependent carboligase